MKTSLRALMEQGIDYAGLFPPAALGMRETVENYARYAVHEHAWALGRLVVPVARLGEVAETARYAAKRGDEPWRLSVLVGDAWRDDLSRLRAFRRDAGDAFVVESAELRYPSDAASLAAIVEGMDVDVFVETPIDDDPGENIAVIGSAGARAKARTGGVSEEMFPSSEQLARFLERCRDGDVAFKLTAGLHHPVRARYPLTYDAASSEGTMHGFLNAFIAACLVDARVDADVVALLEETSHNAFVFEDDALAWRSHRIDIERIRTARRRFVTSFGSCSFEEPIGDLKGIRLL